MSIYRSAGGPMSIHRSAGRAMCVTLRYKTTYRASIGLPAIASKCLPSREAKPKPETLCEQNFNYQSKNGI